MEGIDFSAIRAFSTTGECSNPEDMHYLMALAGIGPYSNTAAVPSWRRLLAQHVSRTGRTRDF